MSGTTRMPRSWRISSAPGVVGPLAASTMISARMASALSSVIWLSSAAGTSTSQSIVSSSAFETSSAPEYPITVPVSAWWAARPVGDRPPGLWMPPFTSDTATTMLQLAEEPHGRRADLPVALDGHPGLVDLAALVLQGGLGDVHDAPAGGVAAAHGPPHRERLARDHTERRVADVHGVRVHDPGHDLLVGAHVRRRDVPVRADQR